MPFSILSSFQSIAKTRFFPIIFNKVRQERKLLLQDDGSLSGAPQPRISLHFVLRAFFSFSHDFHLSHSLFFLFSFTFNFPFISLLSTISRLDFSFVLASEKEQKLYRKSQQLTIMNCLYFCDVFVFLHGCFMGCDERQRRWCCWWERPQVYLCFVPKPTWKTEKNCLPYFNFIFPFIICVSLAIKWAIKCDIFPRNFVVRLEMRSSMAPKAAIFSANTAEKSLFPRHNNGSVSSRKR